MATRKDVIALRDPYRIGDEFTGGVAGCPPADLMDICDGKCLGGVLTPSNELCAECWNCEAKERKNDIL